MSENQHTRRGQLQRRVVGAWLCLAALLAPVAEADYVEVTNDRGVLRQDHSGESASIRDLEAGDLFDLRASEEVNGWLSVTDPATQRNGWVFRRWVRLHSGSRPGEAEHIPVSEPADAGGADTPGLPRAFYTVSGEYYSAGFDPRLKIPAWVQYTLRASDLDGPAARTGLDFGPHPEVPEEVQADDDDYAGSGFAKGHLAPAEDMTRSDAAMLATFHYTNAAPQIGSPFNGSKWRVLEERTREWVRARGELVIIIGPVFDLAPPDEPVGSPNASQPGWVKYRTVGDDEVAVAHGFFRIIYDPHRLEAVAFLLPHHDVTGAAHPIEGFVVSIEEIERRSGIDVLPGLPDVFEEVLEQQRAAELWGGIMQNGQVRAPTAVPPL